jgi:hypothetical protein
LPPVPRPRLPQPLPRSALILGRCSSFFCYARSPRSLLRSDYRRSVCQGFFLAQHSPVFVLPSVLLKGKWWSRPRRSTIVTFSVQHVSEFHPRPAAIIWPMNNPMAKAARVQASKNNRIVIVAILHQIGAGRTWRKDHRTATKSWHASACPVVALKQPVAEGADRPILGDGLAGPVG